MREMAKAIEAAMGPDYGEIHLQTQIRKKMALALEVQHLHPEYAISGSLALIFQGQIPERFVTDLDMCMYMPQDKVKRMANSHCGAKSGPSAFMHSASTHISEMSPRLFEALRYDLFCMSKDCDYWELAGIKFHRAEHIWNAKRVMNREKDRKDLKDCNDGLIIKPFPFHLLPVWHQCFKEEK